MMNEFVACEMIVFGVNKLFLIFLVSMKKMSLIYKCISF